MNDKIQAIASNYLYVIPIVMLLFAVVFRAQKVKGKNGKTPSVDNAFILRNSVFAGVVAAFLLYFNKPLPGLEDTIDVRPANF